jgi:hypothetical protein
MALVPVATALSPLSASVNLGLLGLFEQGKSAADTSIDKAPAPGLLNFEESYVLPKNPALPTIDPKNKYDYDIEGALRDGLSTRDIANQLVTRASSEPDRFGFKEIDGAALLRDFSNRDLIATFTNVIEKDPAKAFARGATRGVIDLAGGTIFSTFVANVPKVATAFTPLGRLASTTFAFLGGATLADQIVGQKVSKDIFGPEAEGMPGERFFGEMAETIGFIMGGAPTPSLLRKITVPRSEGGFGTVPAPEVIRTSVSSDTRRPFFATPRTARPEQAQKTKPIDFGAQELLKKNRQKRNEQLARREARREQNRATASATLDAVENSARRISNGGGVLRKTYENLEELAFKASQVPLRGAAFIEKAAAQLAKADPKSPKYLGAEGGAAAFVGLAGATADLIDPGDPYTRAIAEIGAGFGAVLVPSQILINGASGAGKKVTSVFSESAIQERAGEELVREVFKNEQELYRQARQTELDKAGQEAAAFDIQTRQPLDPDDPLLQFSVDDFVKETQYILNVVEKAVKEAAAAGRIRPPVTQAAERTEQSLTSRDKIYLRELQKKYAQGNAGLSNAARTAASQNLDGLIENIAKFAKIQSTAGLVGLKEFGRLRNAHYEGLLQALVQQSNLAVTDMIVKKLRTGEDGIELISTEISKDIADRLNAIFALARQEESRLYDLVPKDVEMSASNVVSAFREVEKQFESSGNKLVGTIQKFPNSVIKEGKEGTELADINEALFKANKKIRNMEAGDVAISDKYQLILEDKIINPNAVYRNEMTRLTGAQYDSTVSVNEQALNYLTKKLEIDARGMSTAERAGLRRLKDYANALVLKERNTLALNEAVGEGKDIPFVTTSGDLIQFRSDMLRLSRETKDGIGSTDSHFYRRMAEAAEDDLVNASLSAGLTKEQREMGIKTLPEYDNARYFSYALNNVFRRSFIGSVIGKKSNGGDIIYPELISERLFAGRSDSIGLRIKQMNAAVRFLAEGEQISGDVRDTRLFTGDPERFKDLVDDHIISQTQAEDNLLRLIASQVGTKDGQVNPSALSTFVEKHRTLLNNSFPTVLSDLKDIEKAGLLLKQYQADRTFGGLSAEAETTRNLRDLSELFKEYDLPSAVIEETLGNVETREMGGTKTPSTSLKNLIKFVSAEESGVEKIKILVDQREVKQTNIKERKKQIEKTDDLTKKQELEELNQVDQETIEKISQQIANVQDLRKDVEVPPVRFDRDTGTFVESTAKETGRPAIRVGKEGTKPEYRQALVDLIFDRAFQYAGGIPRIDDELDALYQTFEPRKMRHYLFRAINVENESIMDVLKKEGLIDQDKVDEIEANLFNLEKEAAASEARGEGLVDLLSDPISGEPARLFIRGIGARIGAATAGTGPLQGGELQGAQMLASFAEKLLLKLPAQKRNVFVSEMLKDPEKFDEFFSEALRKLTPALKREEAERKTKLDNAVSAIADSSAEFIGDVVGVGLSRASIRQTLIQSVVDITDTELGGGKKAIRQILPLGPTDDDLVRATKPTSAVDIFKSGLKPAPSGQVTPPPQPPTRSRLLRRFQEEGVLPPQGAPQGQTRQRLAQAFPDDPILGTRSGIASLNVGN